MKTALFVCVGNSGRSQMAEAFFNELARGRAKAVSAGTNPAQSVAPEVVLVMKEVVIDISRNKPKRLTEEMLAQADRAVTMGWSGGGMPRQLRSNGGLGAGGPEGEVAGQSQRDKGRDKVKGRKDAGGAGFQPMMDTISLRTRCSGHVGADGPVGPWVGYKPAPTEGVGIRIAR